jgi:sigma-E factor negative regulatory protein RseA
MNPVNLPDDDRLSALADGQLHGDAFAQAMALLDSDPHAADTWHVYHLIGDVLRSDALAPSPADLVFCARLEARLATEPLRIAEPKSPVAPLREAANASVVRWRWAAGSLCAMLVAVVGAGVWNQTAPQATQALAAPVQDTPAQAAAQVMIRDPQLDALMAAHQQLGGHSALQMPAGFLRNATFEQPAR